MYRRRRRLRQAAGTPAWTEMAVREAVSDERRVVLAGFIKTPWHS